MGTDHPPRLNTRNRPIVNQYQVAVEFGLRGRQRSRGKRRFGGDPGSLVGAKDEGLTLDDRLPAGHPELILNHNRGLAVRKKLRAFRLSLR